MRPTILRSAVRSIAAAAFLISISSCSDRKAPVASLSVSPAALHLAWPTATEIEIELTPSRELPATTSRPTLFVHLLDEPGSVVRTFDHELPGAWLPGTPIRYRKRLAQSALVEPLGPGNYLLSVGLYQPGGERFALDNSGAEVARQEYRVATVSVPPITSGGIEARFSPEWLPIEPSMDRQVVATRSLAGGSSGTIRFGPLRAPGTIYLALTVPTSGGDARLELVEGETQPKLRVGNDCGGPQSEVTGTGRFELAIPIPPNPAPVSCELVVEPNFVLRRADRADTVSVRLEELSFGALADAGP